MLHQPKTNQEEDAMRYTGPAKPIPTHREAMSDRAELIWYAVLAVVFVCSLPWL
jgi:hypothetical protein